MSLSTELSGVQAAQTDIDTIGNNIANISTNGFKGSTAQFGDLYATSLLGAANSGATPGQGVTTTSLSQLFTQGTITQTGNPLDVAISGNGFFQVQTVSGLAYTRDGSFNLNSNGQLVTDSGALVLGYSAAASGSGGTASGLLRPLTVAAGNIAATPTSALTINVNLPASDPVINTVTTPFSVNNGNSFDESTTASVYDSLGVSRALTTYFTQVSGSGSPNKWATHYELTDADGAFVASGVGPTLTFNSSGQLVSGSGSISIANLPNGAATLDIATSFAGSTLSNLNFGVNSISNDGNGSGQFTGAQISANGQVTGEYSNGLTRAFGTIALADFPNPQGLIATSNNLWLASIDSGQAASGIPGSAGLGELESGAIEGSNVDLSTQLVNLIAAQQAYQANVQGINVEQQNIQRLLTLQ
jgi:flagellar hook protein FlgE